MTKPFPTASFSTPRSRRIRVGSAPAGADATLRARTGTLASELDGINSRRASGDVSPSEARVLSTNAINGYRTAVQSLASAGASERARVLAVGDRLQQTVAERLAKLSPFDLARLQRRAAAIESDPRVFDAARAVEERDVEGLQALALVQPAAGTRALAIFYGLAEVNQLVAGAAALRAAAAAEAALKAVDELATLDDPWAAKHVASGLEVATDVAPAPSSFAPSTWPRWAAELLDVVPPQPSEPPPADAARAAGGAA